MTKQDYREELHRADLKATPARLGVLEALEQADLPLAAKEVSHYLIRNTIKADRVTVFRIMNTLTNKRIIRPIQFNDGKLRYEYSGKPNHHHFVCEQCGDVWDVHDCNVKQIEKNITQQNGALVKRHSLEFFGLCARCQ